jgi:hypothetical protein
MRAVMAPLVPANVAIEQKAVNAQLAAFAVSAAVALWTVPLAAAG